MTPLHEFRFYSALASVYSLLCVETRGKQRTGVESQISRKGS